MRTGFGFALAAAVSAALSVAGCTGGRAADEPVGTAAGEVAPRLAVGPTATLAASESGLARDVALAFDSTNSRYLAVWQEGFSGEGGKSRILARRLDAEGKPLDAAPFRICVASGVQDSPAVAFAGGRFLVAWSDFRNKNDYDVYFAFVNADGTVSPKDGQLLAGGKGGQLRPSIATDGGDQFLVVWQGFVDDHFAVFGARVAAASGEVLDKNAFTVMDRGECPRVAWNGTNYAVFNKWHAAVVAADGKVAVPVKQLWNSKTVGWSTAAVAWGRAYGFFCTEPWPDPWGWGGGGAVIGVSLAPDGASPERDASPELSKLQAAKADGRVVNCIDATQWRNHPGWPMGMRGGLKGTHDGTWISGRVAAAFNGQSLLVVWPRAHMIDNRRLNNRDLWMARLGPDWALVDSPPVAVPGACTPTEDTNPVLCAGPKGQALLAWEHVAADGVELRCCVITEAADRAEPRVIYSVPQSDTELIVAFHEPLEAASVAAPGTFKLEGLAVKSSALNPDGRARTREVLVTTAVPITRGTRYALTTSGVKDRFGNASAEARFEFLAKPGNFLRGNFIDRWAIIGPFGRDLAKHPFEVETLRPTPGLAAKSGNTELKWQAAKGAVIDFGEIYDEKPSEMAYAATWVYSDGPRDAVLRLDSNDHNRAWLNGRLVHDELSKAVGSRGFHDYRNEVPVKLENGWNRILVQVDNLDGTWVMSGQLVDKTGQAIRDLTWQAEEPNEK